MTPDVILITGHPATGKTTLSHKLAAELNLPLIGKDIIKELLADWLPKPAEEISDTDWSRRLSIATWRLLYQQTEELIRAGVTHIVEANFDPQYSDSLWQDLMGKYTFRPVQIRCEADPNTIERRYKQRITDGSRHMIHVNTIPDPHYAVSIQSHMGWVDIPSPRLSFDTAQNITQNENFLLMTLKRYLDNENS